MAKKTWSLFEPNHVVPKGDGPQSPSAKGRELLNRLWEAEQAYYQEAARTPEAVCRGYGAGSASHQLTEDEDLPLAAGDELTASRVWVGQMLGKIPCVADAVFAEDMVGVSRYLWRAGAGAMIARPRGQIEHPVAYLLQCMRELLARSSHDRRGEKGYFASDTWPRELIAFALVRMPISLQTSR